MVTRKDAEKVLLYNTWLHVALVCEKLRGKKTFQEALKVCMGCAEKDECPYMQVPKAFNENEQNYKKKELLN